MNAKPSTRKPNRVLIIATSLNIESRSQALANEAAHKLRNAEVQVDLLDLRRFSLPLAGSAQSWNDSQVEQIKQLAAQATHLLFAVPIYNFDVNSAAKNLIELLGEEVLGDKPVGFICAAGGKGSYMSVLSFANSLMLDFRCWIVPRFLYVSESFADSDGVLKPEVEKRLNQLLHDLLYRVQPVDTQLAA